MGKAAEQLIWLMKGRSKLAWLGQPTTPRRRLGQWGRTQRASGVCCPLTRVFFRPPLRTRKLRERRPEGGGKKKIQQCWQVCRPCRCPGGRNMWFVYENTQRRKSEEGKTKPAQPIGSHRWGCRMWVNQSASTLCESPLWASDRWLAWFRVFACYQRVIWSSNTTGYQNGQCGKKLNNV